MRQPISVDIKRKCCEMKNDGCSNRYIYDNYFKQQFEDPQAFEAFRHSINKWKNKIYPDEITLECGTYEGFTAHNATVQVSGNGEIVQAWIKQKANEVDPEEFINAIKDYVEPYNYVPSEYKESERMLEIPLFDMHWGIAFMDYYESTLCEILSIINSKKWDKIVIPFGQDFFHNDSIVNGQTTKGTVIEKVDMKRAVKEAKQFIFSLIEASIAQANDVSVIYSPGNHDKSISWMFMQVLIERYGIDVIDDTASARKCIYWNRCFVGLTHGCETKSYVNDLRGQFTIKFSEEFANSDVREIHCGHLHHEKEADNYGVMIRRLSTGGKTDEWSDDNGFIGAHKRFMLFEWAPGKLKSIYYI